MWLIDGARSVGVAAGGSSADAMASSTGVAHIGMHGLEGCCGPHSEWRVASVAVLQDSPSRRDGLSLAHEQQRRLAALVLVRTLGRLLFKDSYVAIATAMVFFHRFYTRQSMTRHAPMVRQCAAFAGAAHWGALGRIGAHMFVYRAGHCHGLLAAGWQGGGVNEENEGLHALRTHSAGAAEQLGDQRGAWRAGMRGYMRVRCHPHVLCYLVSRAFCECKHGSCARSVLS